MRRRGKEGGESKDRDDEGELEEGDEKKTDQRKKAGKGKDRANEEEEPGNAGNYKGRKW